MGDIRFLGRARGGRCVYCHDSLPSDPRSCPECTAAWHPECGRSAARCPTIGCSGPAPGGPAARPIRPREPIPEHAPPRAGPKDLDPDRPRPGAAARFGPYSQLASSAVWSVLGALVGSSFLLFATFDWATFWKHCSTGDEGQHLSPLMAGIVAACVLLPSLAVLLVASYWLLRLPGVIREVRHLLEDTRPTAMRLTVHSRGEGEDRRTFATLVGGDTKLEISLGGLLPPRWLRRPEAYLRTPVLVYGLPPPGPYVIEFRDGSLALVHPD